MNIPETWQIIVAAVTVISAVGWAASYATIREIVRNARELRDHYQSGIADGTISDAELRDMAPHMVVIIEDSAKIWQTARNLIVALISIFRRKP